MVVLLLVVEREIPASVSVASDAEAGCVRVFVFSGDDDDGTSSSSLLMRAGGTVGSK
jgi:hypothetical protein